jgi:hypothetical protein
MSECQHFRKIFYLYFQVPVPSVFMAKVLLLRSSIHLTRSQSLTFESKGKVRPRTGHGVQEGSRGISALDGSGLSTSRPDRFTPGKKTRYPVYRSLGGPQGQSGRVRRTSPHQHSIARPSIPKRVAIPTELISKVIL